MRLLDRLAGAGALGDSPFYDPVWLAAYERSGLGGAVAHHLATDDGAVVPVYDVDHPDPLGALELGAHRTLVTHSWHCYRTLLPTEHDEVLALVRAATELGDRLWACNIDDATVARARAAGADTVRPMATRHVLDLRDHATFDGYLASRSRNLRRDLARHRRAAVAAGAEIACAPLADVDRAGIAGICARIAARRSTPWYYDEARLTTLLDGLVGHPGWSAVTVHRDGDLVAGSVLAHVGSTVHLWAGGAASNERGESFSPGTVLFQTELEHAFAVGAATVEGGRSNGEYKARFGFRPVEAWAAGWDLTS